LTERQAKYLITIAEEGSISKAAKKLYVSQPSLSQMLLNVEKKYGVPLFNRSTGSLTLTYAGEKYMDSIREIMQIERRMLQQFQEIAGSYAGKLSFGITASKGLYLLPAVLPEFRRRYPNIELEIVEGTNPILEEQLNSRRLDLAVLNYTVFHPHLEYVELPEEEMLLIVPRTHRLAAQYRIQEANGKRPAISLHQIVDEPFIYMNQNHGVRAMVDSIFMSLGICPPKALESSNNATAHALVAVGMGITILPDNFIRYVVSERSCLYFSISDASYRRKVALCYPEAPAISKSMEYLVTLITKKMSELYEHSNNKI